MSNKEKEVLLEAAQIVGMPVPESENFNTYMYAHWTVFCIIQPPLLGREETLKNAEILSQVPKNKLIHMNWEQFEEIGMIV